MPTFRVRGNYILRLYVSVDKEVIADNEEEALAAASELVVAGDAYQSDNEWAFGTEYVEEIIQTPAVYDGQEVNHLFWCPHVQQFVVYLENGVKEWVHRKDAPREWCLGSCKRSEYCECPEGYLIQDGKRVPAGTQ